MRTKICICYPSQKMKEFLSKHEKIRKTFLRKVFVINDKFYEIIFHLTKEWKVSTEELGRKVSEIIFPKKTLRKSLRKNLRQTNEIVLKVYEMIN